MKRYVVIFEDSAKLDVRASYEWGLRVWGKRQAHTWARQLREAVLNSLGIVPKAFPLAPEDDEFSVEIRQVVVDRYRVLFTIRGHTVHVLHVRGAYERTLLQVEDDS